MTSAATRRTPQGRTPTTDVTGFGLAGHATEMATASGVTVVLHIDQLARAAWRNGAVSTGFKTRANKSNREFLEPVMRIDDAVDRDRVELAFDPQTSGGLLISVPPEQAAAVSCEQVGEPALRRPLLSARCAHGRTCPWSCTHEHDDRAALHPVARLADRQFLARMRRCRADCAAAVSATSFQRPSWYSWMSNRASSQWALIMT